MFSKDNDEEHVMPSKSDNIQTMSNDIADELIEELFHLNQIRLETAMKGSDFIFDLCS